jgi:hypothetical protein
MMSSVVNAGSPETWSPVESASAKAAILKASQLYSKTDHYDVKLVFKSFKTQDSAVPYETVNGSVRSFKSNVYSTFGRTVTVQLDNVCLTIDSVEKLIVLSRKHQELFNLPTSEMCDQLLAAAKSIQKSDVGKSEIYRLSFENQKYEKVDFVLNDKKQFSKLILFVGEEVSDYENGVQVLNRPRVEIGFYDFSVSRPVDTTLYNVSKYLIVKNDEMRPIAAYAGFKFEDTRFKRK